MDCSVARARRAGRPRAGRACPAGTDTLGGRNGAGKAGGRGRFFFGYRLSDRFARPISNFPAIHLSYTTYTRMQGVADRAPGRAPAPPAPRAERFFAPLNLGDQWLTLPPWGWGGPGGEFELTLEIETVPCPSCLQRLSHTRPFGILDQTASTGGRRTEARAGLPPTEGRERQEQDDGPRPLSPNSPASGRRGATATAHPHGRHGSASDQPFSERTAQLRSDRRVRSARLGAAEQRSRLSYRQRPPGPGKACDTRQGTSGVAERGHRRISEAAWPVAEVDKLARASTEGRPGRVAGPPGKRGAMHRADRLGRIPRSAFFFPPNHPSPPAHPLH
jgi:hypothetical protein